MTSAQSFPERRRQFSDRIVSAVRSAKSSDPLVPVTVLCGPGATDDVTAALAQSASPFVNVEVQPLDIFIHNAAASLDKPRLQRSDVAAEVAAALRPDATVPTVFHELKLNDSAATLEGLTDAVYTLSTLPATWRDQHGGSELPQIASQLGRDILTSLQKRVYTYPEAVDAAARAAAERKIIVVGDIALDPLSEWALERIAPDAEVVEAGELAGAVERRSFVAELDEAKYVADAVVKALEGGAQLHELAVAYCDESALPYLVRAFDEAGISYVAPATAVWAQNPYFRALTLLLRIDPEEMNRRDLAALLATRAMNRDAREAAPSISTFDAVTRNSRQQFYAGEDWQPKEIAEGGLHEQATEIVAWVNALASELREVWGSESWRGLARQLRKVVDRRLRAPRAEETVYADEFFRALERQQGAVDRERAVDALAPLFEKAQPADTRGLVRIGALETLAGRNLHTAFIVGALDDALPGSITPSATITEGQSRLTAESFIASRRRALDAALRATATAVITHPRSHQDGSGRTQPSQWVSLQELKERSITLTTRDEKDGIAAMPQLVTMLLTGQIAPLSSTDVSLIRTAHGLPKQNVSLYRDIMGYRESGAHGDEPGAQFNGYTDSDIGLEFLNSQVSNSALELFTESPQFFFIQRVLEKYVLEDRVHTLDMDARERGTMYHEIFERWTKEVLLGADVPLEYDPAWWAGEGRQALDTIVEETLKKHQTARVNEAVWQGVQTGVWRDINRWYAKERAEFQAGWRPIAAELAFGGNNLDGEERSAPTIHVPTGAGSSAPMSFRGVIDRVDYRIVQPGAEEESTEPYTEIRITDYKTGQQHTKVANRLNVSRTGNPAEKHHFQLALYGWAVHHRFVEEPDSLDWFPEIAQAIAGAPSVRTVHSRYWYFQAPEDQNGEPGITIDDEAIATLTTNLANIYQYIAAGIFPPRPLQPTRWVNDQQLRIGSAQYTAVTEALDEQGLTPLDITTTFAPEA